MEYPLLIIRQQSQLVVYDLLKEETVLQVDYDSLLRQVTLLPDTNRYQGLRMLLVLDHRIMIVRLHHANLYVD